MPGLDLPAAIRRITSCSREVSGPDVAGPQAALQEIEGLGDGGGKQRGVVDGCEKNERAAIGVAIRNRFATDGQPEIVNAAGTGQGDQAYGGVSEEIDDGHEFGFATGEAGERSR